MHLVGFTIEIYYDARSYKRQKLNEKLRQTANYIWMDHKEEKIRNRKSEIKLG